MKDQSQHDPVIDAADVLFLLTEEKRFRDATKDGNDEMAEFQNLNHENGSDRQFRLIPWLCLCHRILEEEALRSHKEAHEWEDREGIDGRNSALRKKKN